MNIVIIDDNYRRGDDRTRIDFLMKLATMSDINLYLYNIKKEEVTKKSIDNILKEAQADILLFPFYENGLIDLWSDYFFKCGVPTVILEEDHYESKFEGLVYKDNEILKWYKDNNINLILRRHYYSEKATVSSVWLPFSANEEEFFPKLRDIKKDEKIGFAGSFTSNQVYYDIRKKAINTLMMNNLLDLNYGQNYDNYPEYLRSHVGGLACTGGILHTCLAKTFEIPLSGSALLTNRMEDSKILWGEETCYFEYKDDCSDIQEIAKVLLNDHGLRNIIIKNAYDRVSQYHTDGARLYELYNILKALISGKDIPKRWGQ